MNSREWLKTGAIAIMAAGLLTIIIVFSRVPILKDFFPLKNFFETALVVHVNLSVVFWMLIFNIIISSFYIKLPENIENIALKITKLSLLLFCISPFLPGDAILNNYIPMLDNNYLYYLALILFFTLSLILSFYFVFKSYLNSNPNHINLLIFASNFLILASFTTLFLSAAFIIPLIEYYALYEYLFWGFGHMLQFVYVALFMAAIMVLLRQENGKDQIIYIIISIHFISGFFGVLIFAKHGLLPDSYIDFYTKHMIYFGGVAPVLLIFYLIFTKSFFIKSSYSIGLYSGILLFLYGGIIAFFIKDSNTIIPAHYHGSTVGITIVMMTIYYFIMQNSLNLNLNLKLVKLQPIIYLSGQILHITGLAISGGYGALRKSPDSIDNAMAKFWMGIMGMGGLLSLIGGLIFIYICYKNLFKKTLI